MQAGLYGVLELQPHKGGVPDYLERSISPIASRANSRAGLFKNTRAATLAELGPGPARTLVEALSTPELMHILKRWQIHHPSGVPLSLVERPELVELAVQYEVLAHLSLCPRLPFCRSCRSLSLDHPVGSPERLLACAFAIFACLLTLFVVQRRCIQKREYVYAGECSVFCIPVVLLLIMLENCRVLCLT